MNKKNIHFSARILLALFMATQIWIWLRYAGAFWLSDSMEFMAYLAKSVDPLRTSLYAFLIFVIPVFLVSFLFHRSLPFGMRIAFYALLGAACSELYLLFMAKFNLVFIARQMWVYLAAGIIAGITYGFILDLPWRSGTSSSRSSGSE